MQTEVPTLPVVQLNVQKSSNRKQDSNIKISVNEGKAHLPCKNTPYLPLNQKRLHPLIGGPYKNSVRVNNSMDQIKPTGKSFVGQRVMSAKMLRFKQLQNQLADAHYHLNELANENRLLKALQKRQDSALKRYEGTNAELPRIINSHYEELRVLQAKYKKLKALHKETADLLKEKETELHTLQLQNKHLLQLSKDRNLAEREKLQMQVSDLNHKLERQQETIQTLHRKLALESKSLKQQLHLEISKHKNTQKDLQETLEKLRSLERLLDNREKRLYYNSQLPVYNKVKHLETQSLTNLRDVSTTSCHSKLTNRSKEDDKITQKNSLPSLSMSEYISNCKESRTVNSPNQVLEAKTETMTSLEQVRKFRLQKLDLQQNSSSVDDFKQLIKLRNSQTSHETRTALYNFDFDNKIEDDDEEENQSNTEEYKRIFKNTKSKERYKLPEDANAELNSSSEDSTSQNDGYIDDNQLENSAKKSRELHARLINGSNNSSNILKNANKLNHQHSVEKNLETFVTRSPKWPKYKYRNSLDLRENSKEDAEDDITDFKVDEATSENNIGSDDLSEINDINATLKTLNLNEKEIGSEPEIDTECDSRFENITNTSNRLTKRQGSLSKEVFDTSDAPLDTSLLSKLHANDNNKIDHTLDGTMYNSNSKNVQKQESENHPLGSEGTTNSTLIKQESEYEEETIEAQNYTIHCTNNSNESKTEVSAIEDVTSLNNKYNYIFGNSNEKFNENSLNEHEKIPAASINKSKEELSNEQVNLDVKTDLINAEVENILKINEKSSNQPETTDINKIDSKDVSQESKPVRYNKEKLLATMKAIDDNENIEFLDHQEFKRYNSVNRSQITENLFRGLPTHSKKRQNVIKDIFGDNSVENKPRNGCSKLH